MFLGDYGVRTDPRSEKAELMMHRGFQRTIKEEEKPGIYIGDHALVEKDDRAFDTTNYFFPDMKAHAREEGYVFDHSVFKREGEFYGRLPLADEKEFPRPQFLERIWRRRGSDLREVHDLPVDDRFLKEQGISSGMKADGFLERTAMMSGVNLNMLEYQIVKSKYGEAYLDIASPEMDIAISIPVILDKEREMELEKEYSGPVDMKKAVEDWLEKCKDFDEGQRDNDYDKDDDFDFEM